MPIFEITLLAREVVAEDTIECRFTKPATFVFKPGQYGGFTLKAMQATLGPGATRRFSFLSAPDDETLAIVTRLQPSSFKDALRSMPMGECVKLAGPSGQFILHEDTTIPAVFIAGGVGIAPFYSMILDALRHTTRKITLFYGNQTWQSAAYLTQLLALASTHPSFQCIPVLQTASENQQTELGFITDDLIKKYVSDLQQPIYYVCGSGRMVQALTDILMTLEIPSDHIKYEDFPGY